MALSDPVNVRLGAERRKKTLQKLAQQMAARAGGRAQGAGAFFRSNVQGRGMAMPSLRLPFALPAGRMRPGGFDPQLDNGAQWGPVLESGPPSTGGGTAFASETAAPAPAPPGTTADFQGTTYDVSGQAPVAPGNYNPNSPAGVLTINAQGDYPLNQAMPSMSYPDPWTIMATEQLRRLMGGVGGRTYGV